MHGHFPRVFQTCCVPRLGGSVSTLSASFPKHTFFFAEAEKRICCTLFFMYTIVGLGNPGGEYVKNRHNAGRNIVGAFAKQHALELKEQKKPGLLVGAGDVWGEKVRAVLPNTYMNKSGGAVSKYVKSVSAAKNLIVVYDDIDLPLGKVRVSFGSSSGGHNGVRSVERAVKTKNFIKIRIGVSKSAHRTAGGEKIISAKKPEGDKAVVEYLLGNFTKGELEKLEGPVYERASLAIRTILETGDPVLAMNAVNGLPLV